MLASLGVESSSIATAISAWLCIQFVNSAKQENPSAAVATHHCVWATAPFTGGNLHLIQASPVQGEVATVGVSEGLYIRKKCTILIKLLQNVGSKLIL